MILRLKKHLPALVTLNSFALFPEYFISISLIYILIVVVLSSYNVYGLIIQQCLSECIAVILLLTCCLIINNDTSVLNFTNFNNSILNDYFAFLAKNFICLFSAVYLLIISNFFKEQKLVSFEYLLIILFSILGFLVMCCSNDLLIAYLSMELSSLAFYILAAFRKTSTYSIESGVKYFIIGAISSSLFLLGSSFIYGCTGSINFLDFQDLLNLSFPCLDLNCFLNK